jgi:mannan endo-1,4-beta-mannosidase
MNANAKRLLNYIADQYGKNIISGQMDTSWTTNERMDMIARVYTDTGKYPALKGFDFIQHPYPGAPFYNGREQMVEALEWWEGKNRMNGQEPAALLLPDNKDVHGIVTFCWHWRVGPEREFYTERTKFRIPWENNALDLESADFKALIKDMDIIALLLNELKEKDVPVLWRPFHEAAGGWFWWGASGAEPCIALWEFMHDYFTHKHGLDNLIWVWSMENAEWYPNPDTVDIVGRDFYAPDHSSQKQEFDRVLAMAGGRKAIVALSENGRIPDPELCIRDGAMWSWFMTWNDFFNSSKGNFWDGEAFNPQEHKMKVFHHPAVITLEKLPDLTAYRLN